jgi:hypothetical protein
MQQLLGLRPATMKSLGIAKDENGCYLKMQVTASDMANRYPVKINDVPLKVELFVDVVLERYAHE